MADCLCAYISIPILKHSHSSQNPFLLPQNCSIAGPKTSKKFRKCTVFLCKSTAEPTSTIPSSSEFDVVGIHEHHDGSLIFKFGDPSEAAVLEESNFSSVNEIDRKVESLNVASESLDTVNSAALHSLNSSVTSLSSGIEDPGVMSSQKVRGFFEGTINFREDSSEESRDVNNVKSFKLNIVVHGVIEPVVPLTESEPVIDTEAVKDTPSLSHRPVLDEKAGSVEEDSCSNARSPEPVVGSNASAIVVMESASLDEETDHSSSQSSEPARPSLDEEPVPIAVVEQDVSTTESSKINHEAQILASKEQMSLDSKEILVEGIILVSGAAMLPRPDKLTGGEDAYFVSDNNWLGIADGVGQWSEDDINPGIYARELMENCKKIVSDGQGSEVISPEEVLKLGAAKCKAPGSSTVLIAYFDSQAQVLHVANIGDSGFLILKNGNDPSNKSVPMSYYFNCPHQIESGDDPSDIIKPYKVELDEGDIIILATDGLFDNLYDKEIATNVSSSLEAGIGVKEIAELLARRAQEVGKSTSERTPFADAAKEHGYAGFAGGKPDDVTVIVSLVKKESNTDHSTV